MKTPLRSASLLLIGTLCAPYAVQAAPQPIVPPEKETPKATSPALPPIPPGVPTTPDNVQLPTEGEVKLGRDGAAEVEKELKVITSGPYYDRLQRVAKTVVSAIERPDIVADYLRAYNLPKKGDKARRVPFEFSFKVLDDEHEINAFSLAGGPIYVSKALMDYAPSDHELAAVLAHECTHVAFHHVEQLVKKQRKAQGKQLFGLLAAVIAGAATGGAGAAAAGNVLVGAQLVSIARLSGYGRDLESQADRIGIRALAGTQYSPVGMLTFMQKLQTQDTIHGNPEFGIFQSHPYTNERVVLVRQELEKMGYSTDTGAQRKASGSFRLVQAPRQWNGRQVIDLRLNGNLMYTVACGENGMSTAERARKITDQLNMLFLDNLTFNDVRQSADKTALLLKGVMVIRALPDDAAVAGSAEGAIQRAYTQINRALWGEKLNQPS